MSANLDMTLGRASMAFVGSRRDIWHRMGEEMQLGQSIEDWSKAAGFGWEAVKVPAIAALSGDRFDHLPSDRRFLPVADRSFVVRSDTGGVLGYVSGEHNEGGGYQIVQPKDVLDWFQQYISVDDRFQLDVAGCLDGGKRLWATATYRGGIDIAGEAHGARVLMSTTFDGSGATVNQATMTRVVCQNTLRMAHADKRAAIRTRHSTKFDAKAVGKELSQLAQSFANFKKIGDAMAQVHMSADQVADFFKACLEIPHDAKKADISTRKQNQYADVSKAYITSVAEGAERNSPWAALQAITRYVDHDRSVKKGDGTEDLARFNAAQFGAGDQMKGKAMELLMPLVKDRIPELA